DRAQLAPPVGALDLTVLEERRLTFDDVPIILLERVHFEEEPGPSLALGFSDVVGVKARAASPRVHLRLDGPNAELGQARPFPPTHRPPTDLGDCRLHATCHAPLGYLATPGPSEEKHC